MDLDTIDQLLTTTRAVRRRLDFSRPVEPEVIERCIQIAIHAPSSSNRQHWHFLVLTDPQKKAVVADYYRRSFEAYLGFQDEGRSADELTDPLEAQNLRVRQSAIYLARHMGEVPVLIIPCVEGRAEKASQMAQATLYGSILPATWSLMLALRARGLGSAWTTLHLHYEKEVAQALGIPENVTQAALIPVAYYTGQDFKPAERLSAARFTHWNAWGQRR